MVKLTITLTEQTHRALKEASARTGKTMAQIVEESLELFLTHARDQARELLARARYRANLNEQRALDIAHEETRALRDGKAPDASDNN